MEIGDSLHVKDLKLPANVQILCDPEAGVVNIVAPTVIKEETEEDKAAAPADAKAAPAAATAAKAAPAAAKAAPAAAKAAPAAAKAAPAKSNSSQLAGMIFKWLEMPRHHLVYVL